jgi:hypothetical protein
MSRKNGGIIGPANTPVGGLITGLAGGVWRMNDVANFVGNSQWPLAPQSIDNSLRFEGANSDYLVRTPSSASNEKTFTFSTWVKRITSGSDYILTARTGTSTSETFQFGWRNDQIQITSQSADGNTTNVNIRSNALFRDFSAWYHLVCAIDTTQGTSTDRVKLYVNGSQVTSLENTTYPSQNDDLYGINGTLEHALGRETYQGGTHYHSYYLAETVLIDGQQLDPTSFGEFDTTTGIWKPKKIGQIANAGTNSFYLDFKDSSNVGNDASGLNNDFTVNNLTSIDQSTDTCVENYATLIPNFGVRHNTQTYSNGNLTVSDSGGGFEFSPSTIAPSSGKWYFEAKMDSKTNYPSIGFQEVSQARTNNYAMWQSSKGYALHHDGQIYRNNSSEGDISGSYTTGDILSVALDLDNGKAYFAKNGTFLASANPASGSNPHFSSIPSGSYFIGVSNYGSAWSANFGGTQSFTISSGNSDANGYGNFEYSVPSGYYALNTSNLNTYG